MLQDYETSRRLGAHFECLTTLIKPGDFLQSDKKLKVRSFNMFQDSNERVNKECV